MTTRDDVLCGAARAAGDAGVSGEVLAASLSVSAGWRSASTSRRCARLGYEIEAAPGSGYRLLSAPDLPLPAEVRPLLTPGFWTALSGGRETGSTNDDARALARAGAAEGTVVLASRQTAGRGRLGRSWASPDGGAVLLGGAAAAASRRPRSRRSRSWWRSASCAGSSALGVDAAAQVAQRRAARRRQARRRPARDVGRVRPRRLGGRRCRRQRASPARRAARAPGAAYLSRRRGSMRLARRGRRRARRDRPAYAEWRAAGSRRCAPSTRRASRCSDRACACSDLARQRACRRRRSTGVDDEGRLLVRGDDGVVSAVAAGEVTLRREHDGLTRSGERPGTVNRHSQRRVNGDTRDVRHDPTQTRARPPSPVTPQRSPAARPRTQHMVAAALIAALMAALGLDRRTARPGAHHAADLRRRARRAAPARRSGQRPRMGVYLVLGAIGVPVFADGHARARACCSARPAATSSGSWSAPRSASWRARAWLPARFRRDDGRRGRRVRRGRRSSTSSGGAWLAFGPAHGAPLTALVVGVVPFVLPDARQGRRRRRSSAGGGRQRCTSVTQRRRHLQSTGGSSAIAGSTTVIRAPPLGRFAASIRAAVRGDDRADDREPQPRAAARARAARVGAVEAVEEARQVGLGNAGAVVDAPRAPRGRPRR